MNSIDHIGIVVEDLEATVAFARDTFGLEIERRAEVPEKGVSSVFLAWGDASIELIQHRDPALRSQLLGDSTARLDHVAVKVDDLDSYVDELHEQGVMTGTPAPIWLAERRTIFVDPKSTHGIKLQFVQIPDQGDTA